MPQINDDGPVPYVRSMEGKTETMIPIGPHEAVNETSAKALGLAKVRDELRSRPCDGFGGVSKRAYNSRIEREAADAMPRVRGAFGH